MRHLTGTLVRVCRRLIPAGRPRWILLALVLAGAALPLAELVVAKLFADIITAPSAQPLEVAPSLAVFAGLFLAARFGHYFLRTRRVAYLNAALRDAPAAAPPTATAWRWALGLELLTVLTSGAQLALISAYVIHLAPLFGLANLLLLIVLLEAIGRLFHRQLIEQSGPAARSSHPHANTHARVRSRVLSAERGALLASLGALGLLVLVVALSLDGRISAATALVLFLSVRLQNTTLAGLSGAVMRLARAEARSQRAPTTTSTSSTAETGGGPDSRLRSARG